VQAPAKEVAGMVALRTEQTEETRRVEHKSRPRVLVVDDDRGMRSMIRDYLVGDGFEVDEASSSPELVGRVLVSIATAHPYDVIVSDQVMAGGTGLEALSAIRVREISVPFILMSAFADPPLVEKSISCGAARMFSKPLDVEALSRAIRDLAPADRG
jgi:DNA-binding NtrC family response regulator